MGAKRRKPCHAWRCVTRLHRRANRRVTAPVSSSSERVSASLAATCRSVLAYRMRCLALNASFEPLTMVPVRRALRLVIDGKAVIVEADKGAVVRSERLEIPRPAVIRLVRFVHVARRHQCLDQRPHGLQLLQHAQGQPAAGRGGDAPDPRAVRAALRAPLLGGAAAHADPEPLHPAVLRWRRARHPRGDVSGGKLPWLIAGGATLGLVAVLVVVGGAKGANHPDPRPGVTAERVLPPLMVVPNTPSAAEAYAAARGAP